MRYSKTKFRFGKTVNGNPRRVRRTSVGYRFVKVNRRCLAEGRAVMEKHIGRKLGRFEFVHHKDENPDNNKISNLQIVSPKEHSHIHRLIHPLIRKCIQCGKMFEPGINRGTIKNCSMKCAKKSMSKTKTFFTKQKVLYILSEEKKGRTLQEIINGMGRSSGSLCLAKHRYGLKSKTDKHRESLRRNPPKRKCLICGVTFLIKHNHHVRTCSRKCGYILMGNNATRLTPTKVIQMWKMKAKGLTCRDFEKFGIHYTSFYGALRRCLKNKTLIFRNGVLSLLNSQTNNGPPCAVRSEQ